MEATVMTAKELRQQLRLRCAIGTLAKQKAKKRIMAMVKSRGQRISDYTCRELSLMAESYLEEHRAELVLVRPLAKEIVLGKR